MLGVLVEHGDEATEAILELTDGVSADASLECVGFVGVPHGVEVPIGTMFSRNIGLRGGTAPVHTYLLELLDDVLACRIQPGGDFDFETGLDDIAEAYATSTIGHVVSPEARSATLKRVMRLSVAHRGWTNGHWPDASDLVRPADRYT